jgi:hypothetical protein
MSAPPGFRNEPMADFSLPEEKAALEPALAELMVRSDVSAPS